MTHNSGDLNLTNSIVDKKKDNNCSLMKLARNQQNILEESARLRKDREIRLMTR